MHFCRKERKCKRLFVSQFPLPDKNLYGKNLYGKKGRVWIENLALQILTQKGSLRLFSLRVSRKCA